MDWSHLGMSGPNKRLHRPKHTPLRSCVVCRAKLDKRQLTRIVHNDTAGVVVDPTGKLNGRGAYICPNPACWTKMVQGKLLDTALRTTITAVQKADLYHHYQTKLALKPPAEAVTGE